MMFYNIAAAEFDAALNDTAAITGIVSYQRATNDKTEEDAAQDLDTDVILLNKLALEDRKGHR